jgi:hypothetical protein
VRWAILLLMADRPIICVRPAQVGQLPTVAVQA